MTIYELNITQNIWRYVQEEFRPNLPQIFQECLSLREEINEEDVSFLHSEKEYLNEQGIDIHCRKAKRIKGRTDPGIYLTFNSIEAFEAINALSDRIDFIIKYPHVSMFYTEDLPEEEILEIENILMELSDYYKVDTQKNIEDFEATVLA